MTGTHPAHTRKPLFFMGATYFLGAFNDNFYKQAALLLAVSMGRQDLQGTGTTLFALPFIVCAAWSGWLADRFPKRNVVVFSKSLELCATLTGAVGIVLANWTLVLAMIFLMGLQSTIFGPSLNGSVPELFDAADVPGANAVLKLFTTLAILLGMALGGAALDQDWFSTRQVLGIALPFGRLLVGWGAVTASCLGLAASFGMRRLPAAGTREPFPWAGPLKSLRETRAAGRDPLLAPACLCMGLALGATSFAPLVPEGIRYGLLFGLLVAAGLAGGVFLIPIASFIQVRPAAADKGKVIAAASFVSFVAIFLAGQAFDLLLLMLPPAGMMAGCGVGTVLGAAVFWRMADGAGKQERAEPPEGEVPKKPGWRRSGPKQKNRNMQAAAKTLREVPDEYRPGQTPWNRLIDGSISLSAVPFSPPVALPRSASRVGPGPRARHVVHSLLAQPSRPG